MKRYRVTGMTCAACAARVEKAVSAVGGVTQCTVSLLTDSMTVSGTAGEDEIIRAVEEAGYGAAAEAPSSSGARLKNEKEMTAPLLTRLAASAAFLLVLLYFSMGHDMLGLRVPAFFENDPAAAGLLQLLLSAAVLIINNRFFVSGLKSALHGAPNMDTLVALGSSVSFMWSVIVLFRRIDVQMTDGAEAARQTGHLYFESAAMILVLISVGKLLEAKSRGKTTDALKGLMKLAPATAAVIRDGKEITIPAAEMLRGDIFVVRPGESIPADGVITEGETAVNEAALTGESIPADKGPGDEVFAATVSQSGFIRCKALRVGEESTLSQIIRAVEDAAASKAPIAGAADRAAGVFVPVVLGIAAVTLTVWLLLGAPPETALTRAVSVLVISCPCSLGLATPVAVMVGSGVGAKHGILFKTAAALEQTGRINVVALDKTGTITEGEPAVCEILPADGVTEDELLSAACSVEVKSEHPLARAVVRKAAQRGIEPSETEDFTALPGRGVAASLHGKRIAGGSERFIRTVLREGGFPEEKKEELAGRGLTPLFFAADGALLGILAVSDRIKPDSARTIRELSDLGVLTVMLTGDNVRCAEAIGKQAGIGNVIAGVLPEGKEEVLRRLSALGRTAMVGDGVNDAPALTCADTGIAVGGGADIAADAADVVLMNGSLTGVAAAIRLSRAALRNIRENLFWAFCYNALCIPFAAGCFSGLFGFAPDPMLSAAAMSLSSFCVVTNALRLNLFDPGKSGRKKRTPEPKAADALRKLIKEIQTCTEEKMMTKTIRVEGMMCPHCEAHTKQALEAVDGVTGAVASFRDGTAQVTLEKDVPFAVLKEAIEKAGYTVPGDE